MRGMGPRREDLDLFCPRPGGRKRHEQAGPADQVVQMRPLKHPQAWYIRTFSHQLRFSSTQDHVCTSGKGINLVCMDKPVLDRAEERASAGLMNGGGRGSCCRILKGDSQRKVDCSEFAGVP